MTITSSLVHGMEVDGVFLKQVRRGQISTAAKPPASIDLPVAPLKVAVVGMHRGRHGVVGMKHQAQARRKKIEVFAGQIMATSHLGCCFRTEGPVDNADVHTGFLENLSLREHTAPTATAFFSRP